jgi:hypothetical protein
VGWAAEGAKLSGGMTQQAPSCTEDGASSKSSDEVLQRRLDSKKWEYGRYCDEKVGVWCVVWASTRHAAKSASELGESESPATMEQDPTRMARCKTLGQRSRTGFIHPAQRSYVCNIFAIPLERLCHVGRNFTPVRQHTQRPPFPQCSPQTGYTILASHLRLYGSLQSPRADIKSSRGCAGRACWCRGPHRPSPHFASFS